MPLSHNNHVLMYRSNRPEVFLKKGILKICSKFTGEHPYRSVISIKLLCNVIEIALPDGCSPVNLLYIFRTPFPKNTSGRLLLNVQLWKELFYNVIYDTANKYIWCCNVTAVEGRIPLDNMPNFFTKFFLVCMNVAKPCFFAVDCIITW